MDKILITGSRFPNPDISKKCSNFLESLLDKKGKITILVGDAEGIDSQVIDFCDEHSLNVIVHGAYGKIKKYTGSRKGFNLILAGDYIYRDNYMAFMSDECVAFWDGHSPGTKHTFEFAKGYLKPVTIVTKDGVEFYNQ